ncbi:MAG: ABC transporter substrate-binding protein [Acidobacteria bacterium]|nr:ABC transporter substrate-binding protein [Acidobacteriota bacterium]
MSETPRTPDRPGLGWALSRAVLAVMVVAGAGTLAIIPPKTVAEGGPSAAAGPEIAADVPGAGGEVSAPTDAGSQETARGPERASGPKRRSGLACARGRNGGPTDTGVTADRIRLASTVVQSGPGSSFLGSSPIGMQAVVRKVNRAGGICGRLLDLTLRDDAWDAGLGRKFIRNFIDEGYFALPVVPSSEGLTAAIENRDIGEAGIPVVGTDGMLIQQYKTPWVWPVATATVSAMRVMARYGYQESARAFGIVYDQQYRFGREGAEAFKAYVQSLPGSTTKAYVGIRPGQASYSSEIRRFNEACGGKCDFVAMLLEPQTALTWLAGRPQMGTLFTSGAQTLFNEEFAANCGEVCGGMLVWTGYNPAIGFHATRPDVATYRSDVLSVSPTVDETNQFLEGAYLGMSVFVEALRAVGPNLTRARLRDALNSMAYESDLAGALRWTSAKRFANRGAQAFEIVVAQGAFAGFRDRRTGFVQDPTLP